MNQLDYNMHDTICAISTATGVGGIAVIRVSGKKAYEIITQFMSSTHKLPLPNQAKYTTIVYQNNKIDDVIITYFKAPYSYTGEDIVEISCHGSVYIQQTILQALINEGCRLAEPGEFTFRAFLNGKMDLSQSEAVNDLIHANSKTAHDLAYNQMRGGFSQKIKVLKKQMIEFTALIELELDFAEEDVEFANRSQLLNLIEALDKELSALLESYSLGNVIKNGVPVAIVGQPNVGKSTLLNALLNDEKAIVSDIPGTTRDTIEDTITIKGVTIRFIDTAGIREKGEDKIENIGIDRTFERIAKAKIVLFVFDMAKQSMEDIQSQLQEIKYLMHEDAKLILIGNKVDELKESPAQMKALFEQDCLFISAKRKTNIELVTNAIAEHFTELNSNTPPIIVSNLRHYESLKSATIALEKVQQALNLNISGDLLSIDLRDAIQHLANITGEITSDDVFEHIFRNFCIGK